MLPKEASLQDRAVKCESLCTILFTFFVLTYTKRHWDLLISDEVPGIQRLYGEGLSIKSVEIADRDGNDPTRHSTMYKMYLSSTIVSNSIWDTTGSKQKFDKYVSVVLNYVQQTWGFRERCLPSLPSDNLVSQNIATIVNCVRELSSHRDYFAFIRDVLVLSLSPVIVSLDRAPYNIKIQDIKINRLVWSISYRIRPLKFRLRVKAFVWMVVFISLCICGNSTNQVGTPSEARYIREYVLELSSYLQEVTDNSGHRLDFSGPCFNILIHGVMGFETE